MAKKGSSVSLMETLIPAQAFTGMTKAQTSKVKRSLRSGIEQFVFYLRIISFIELVLFGIFFFYLREMRISKCECAQNWKRDFLTFATGYIFLCQLALLFQPLLNIRYPVLATVEGIVSIAFIVIAISYIQDLRKNKCQCSEGWERTTMEVYVYFMVTIVTMAVLMGLIGLFSSL